MLLFCIKMEWAKASGQGPRLHTGIGQRDARASMHMQQGVLAQAQQAQRKVRRARADALRAEAELRAARQIHRRRIALHIIQDILEGDFKSAQLKMSKTQPRKLRLLWRAGLHGRKAHAVTSSPRRRFLAPIRSTDMTASSC